MVWTPTWNVIIYSHLCSVCVWVWVWVWVCVCVCVRIHKSIPVEV